MFSPTIFSLCCSEWLNLGKTVIVWLWETRNKTFPQIQPHLDKPSDSPLEKAIKNVIKDMLEVKAEDRPTTDCLCSGVGKCSSFAALCLNL